MRAGLTAWLERRWYGGVAPGAVLRAFSAAYGWWMRRRRAAYGKGRRSGARAAVPTIVVGNLTVGGAGKTPLVLAMLSALRARGWRPGVISRGYGGTAPGPERVLPDSDPARVGDEPALIAQRSGAPVAIARKRIAAAEQLAKSGEIDLLIADDGLQHYALPRDLEILVIDGRRRFGNARTLPAGPLRESVERVRDCDFIVVNGGEAQADEVQMQLAPDDAIRLVDGVRRPLNEFSGQRVHAVAAIGDPSRFFQTLIERGIEVVPHPFPDHHAFVASDLRFKESLPILMTEKDAVKCRRWATAELYAVPVDARLPDAFFDAVDARLRRVPQGDA
jgi:tetraacyldisaccharide 4'-kinase